MQAGMIDGATRVLGKSQGYIGLPVRDDRMESGTPIMTTSWTPTPKEIEAINAGAPIHVTLIGDQHPPIMVGVSTPPLD